MQAEQVPLFAEAVQNIIKDETKWLRHYLGLEGFFKMFFKTFSACASIFFIERALNFRNDAKCQLPCCPDKIKLNKYRVALNPDMNVSSQYFSQNSGKFKN